MADRPLKRMLQNVSALLGGNVAGALLGFLSSLIAARALGPEALGAIVLVQAFALGVDKLVNFQSWRAIIKFGAHAIEAKDHPALARVLRFGLLVDLATAAFAALLVIVGSFPMARAFDWSPELHAACIAYGATLTLNISGAPIAVLRLFDRFRAFALQRMFAGTTKLVLVAVAWALGAPPWAFLSAWLVADLVAYLSLLVLGWQTYRANDGASIRRASIRGIRDEHPGIVGFLLTTNASTALRLVTREADVFIVGAWLGDTAVGLYKVARQFASLAAQAYDPLSHVVYPDLARHVARKDPAAFRRTLALSGLLASGIAAAAWLGTALLGGWAIEITVGPEFSGSVPILEAYVVAVSVNLGTFFLGPAAMALNHPKATLHAITVASVAYFASLVPLMNAYGATGAGWAQVVLSVVLASWMIVEVTRKYVGFRTVEAT